MPSTPAYPRFTGAEPCASVGTETFFTDDDTPLYRDVHAIKAICTPCPMREECRDYALRVSVQGIWGGTTEADRRRLRRELGIIPVALVRTYDHATVTADAARLREQRAALKTATAC